MREGGKRKGSPLAGQGQGSALLQSRMGTGTEERKKKEKRGGKLGLASGRGKVACGRSGAKERIGKGKEERKKKERCRPPLDFP